MKKGRMKLTALLAVCLLSVSVFSGCQKTNSTNGAGENDTNTPSTEASGGDDSVLDMAWWGNQVRNERTQAALDKYHELDASTTINGQFFQWDDYWNKLATQAAGKKMPDIVQMDYSYINTYTEKNQLLDLKPYIESGAIETDNIDEKVLTMGEVGEGIYGIAAGINAPCIFYNKTLLAENGIQFEDNLTLDQFKETAKQIADKTGYKATIISTVNGSDLGAWTRAHDFVLTKEGYPGTAEEYTPFFQILSEGIADGWHTSPELVTDSVSVEQSPLVYGSTPETMTWCIIGTSNMLTAYQSAAPEGTEIGITTIPSDDLVKSNYLKPSMFFSISANTANPDAAVKVLNYLINSSEANEIMLGERGMPASKKIQDEILPQLSEVDERGFNYVNDVVTPNSTPIGPAAPTGSGEVDDTLKKVKEKVGYGELTPEQAASEFFVKANEIYSKNN